MARRTRRKCRHCKHFFIPDPRNAKRQQYCREQPCRAASKAASQRRWLNKPENRDVFKGPIHVARVQAWRQAHPGYWRRSPARVSPERVPLQDSLLTQAIDNHKESGQFVGTALQDILRAQPTVFLGLLAQFSDSTLQEDIARLGRRLLRLGYDVLNGNDQPHDPQTAHRPRQRQAPTPTVLLD